ncbi:TetR/AcrR family transcriptional regulator [Pelagibius sp.]|uniref:TetR/AcrR family transcriptional regulator n=1 Tax=Pelagibius sp. TaxID=1931238 RepID=UPI003B50B799
MADAERLLSKGEARRAAILAAARQALLDDGYSQVSLRMITQVLGISLGNLQYYFPTKDSLIAAVIVQETERSAALLRAIAWDPKTPERCIREAVEALLRSYAGPAGRFYAIAEFLALDDPRYARLKAEGYGALHDDTGRLVAVMAPHLDEARCAALARVLMALIDGAALQLQIADGQTENGRVDAMIDDISRAMGKLLESWE